jgi:hypothetical protein
MQEREISGDYSMRDIVGKELSAVTFVMDYHQIWFNSTRINIVTELRVLIGDSVYRLGDPGYRDKLCDRITHVVVKAEARKGDAMEIVFDDGSAIVVPVRDEDHLYGPECIIYQAPTDWWVL